MDKKIYEYDNYREFLKDRIHFLKSKNLKYSVRYFGKKAGFSSTNFLSLILSGKRNLSPASIQKIASAMELDKAETAFFKNLVLMNQALTLEEKQQYAMRVGADRGFQKAMPLVQNQFNYYTHWYYVVIREMVGMKDFRDNPQWIAARLGAGVTPADVSKAIDALLELKLLKRDGSGKLIRTTENLITDNEVVSAMVVKFHHEMIKLAGESIARHPKPLRDISGVTFLLSKSRIAGIKEMIQKFRLEVSGGVPKGEEPDAVFQLNLQLFPVALPEEDSGQ